MMTEPEIRLATRVAYAMAAVAVALVVIRVVRMLVF
jgi:hypothetical protein